MPTEFYFEIMYFNFDRKITITLLHSHRNTQQWQVHDVIATVDKTPPYRGSAKSENLPTQKKLFYVHLNSVVLDFTEF